MTGYVNINYIFVKFSFSGVNMYIGYNILGAQVQVNLPFQFYNNKSPHLCCLVDLNYIKVNIYSYSIIGHDIIIYMIYYVKISIYQNIKEFANYICTKTNQLYIRSYNVLIEL